MTTGLEIEGRDRVARRPGDAARPTAAGPFKALRQIWPGRFANLTSRIILTNFGGLLILVVGLLYFNESKDSLIDSRVNSLMTQARLMAAAVASRASIDTGQIVVNPDRLLEQKANEDRGVDLTEYGKLEYLIRPEQAGPVIRRLARSTDTRARIYSREGLLVVDSRALYGRGEILRLDLAPVDKPQELFIKRWLKNLDDWFYSRDFPPQKVFGLENGMEFPEVKAALHGASASVVRVNKENEIIITVAVPVQRFKAVLGALILSTEGDEINKVLRKERRLVLITFAIAALAAVFLSVAMASQIAEPMRRLAAAADDVRQGINRRTEIPDFTTRRDEIGHLSGALRDMTNALYDRIDAIEAFAADVSHELKNPLTSLRSAVETLHYAKSDEQRERLVEIVKDDVRRLDRLISDISDASRLDAELARATARPVDMAELVETLVSLGNEMRKGDDPVFKLTVRRVASDVTARNPFTVLGHDTRLGQVLRNLMDNAKSFSPADSNIEVRLSRMPDHVELVVEDQGPGLNPDNLERIFARFYTDRPETAFGKNSGLGLSISKQIVEAHRGTIRGENVPDQADPEKVAGARFVVRIPALREKRKTPRET